MTLGNQPIPKKDFYNISLTLGYPVEKILKKIQHIRHVLKEKGKKVQCFNGRGLISLVFPDDLFFEIKNKPWKIGFHYNEGILVRFEDNNYLCVKEHQSTEDISPKNVEFWKRDESTVRIYKGVLYEGTLNKAVLGATTTSLIQIINKEYGPDEACSFIDGVQFITNNWLLLSGFSIGIEDCLIQGEAQNQNISDVVQKCYIEAEGIKTTTTHPGIREVRITGTLSKAKDIGLKIAKDSLSNSNNFLSTVKSQSKGDWFNIAQITGLLGQQNILGKRVVPTLNNGKRTLPHYPMEINDISMEYESRGFISSSFITGLNPREFYYHSMSGREGCSDTAMNTATSGYIQRRIIKLTEDIKVHNDNTVRDSLNSIYQVAYGEDGVNPTTTIKVDGAQEICDVASIVNKLNVNYENTLQKDNMTKKTI